MAQFDFIFGEFSRLGDRFEKKLDEFKEDFKEEVKGVKDDIHNIKDENKQMSDRIGRLETESHVPLLSSLIKQRWFPYIIIIMLILSGSHTVSDIVTIIANSFVKR